MLTRTPSNILGQLGLAATAALIASSIACGSSGGKADGGKGGGDGAVTGVGGMGGRGGSGGGTGGSGGGAGGQAGGTGGQGGFETGGTGGFPPPPACEPRVAIDPLLTDFTGGDTFGDFNSTPSGVANAYGGLAGDTTGGNWHVAGTVAGSVGSSAFFIDFLSGGCPADLSAYDGISFTIGGKVGPTNRITLQVFTAEDNYVALGGMPATDADIVVHNMCRWTTNMYAECIEPSRSVTVPATATSTAPTTLSFTWAQFTGGRPRSTPNPKLITRIQFLPVDGTNVSDGDGGFGYGVDVVIDDLALIPKPGDGGIDAATDGGVTVDAAPDAPTEAPASDDGGGN